MQYKRIWSVGKHSSIEIIDNMTEDQIKYDLLKMFRAEEKGWFPNGRLDLDLDNLKFTGISLLLNEPFSIVYEKIQT